MERVDQYYAAVQRKVCEKCIDRNMAGQCGLSGEQECALKLHFPEILKTVLSIKSDSIEPYVTALRLNVCSVCKHQSNDGMCSLRTQLDCGLDRYFPLIVEAIEETKATYDAS